MRRPSLILISTVAFLALAGVAVAENRYSVINTGQTPKGTGSLAKPLPLGVSFGYTTSDSDPANRAVPVSKYKVASEGLIAFPAAFPKCRFADTLAGTFEAVMAKCRKARVGSGWVYSLAGAEQNPTDKSSVCNLRLTQFNLGDGMALRLDADPPLPTSTRGPGCTIPLHTSIRARFVQRKVAGLPASSLEWTTPYELNHALPGIASYVWESVSKTDLIEAKARYRGKMRTVGYYSSVGCGKDRKRVVQVTFGPESGPAVVERTFSKC